ncbi:CU044_5270 family protein [Nonomuraea sp. SBT364]|uniref:CU044_5270 family protein n=1 Tax=Nonomuraea sp. SBT364 TaxID=1580530 RepID=UPI00066E2F31|nr:CU044_5270 family protein [Nonomuraea sp. SBT364]
MDELDALRQMRTSLAHQESPDVLALRAGRRPAPPRRLRLRVPAVSLLATAALVAATLAAVSLPSDVDRPVPPAAEAAPGNALLVAAANVRTDPAGTYWHTSRVSGRIYAIGTDAADHYKVESRLRYDHWTGRSGQACSAVRDLPARPWSARDRQHWQRAGSPAKVRVPSGATLFFEAPDREPACRPTRDQRFYGMTPRQLAALPTEPERLKNALLDLEGDWKAYAPKVTKQPIRALKGEPRVRALSDVAGTLLALAPTPPAVRAAAYRMLATLPGVRIEGDTTDPLGRAGVAISLPLETTIPLGLSTAPRQLGTYRRQWIINPAGGTLLAMRDLVATPPRGSRTLPPGDDGKPRRLTAATQPDRFHRPGEVSAYETYEGEWTDVAPR